MSAHSCTAGFVYISAWLKTFSLDLNFTFLVNNLFLRMGNNKPIDERIVQKVFETSAAGESRSTVGAFFSSFSSMGSTCSEELLIGIVFTNFCEELLTGAQDYKGGRSVYSPVLGKENAFG